MFLSPPDITGKGSLHHLNGPFSFFWILGIRTQEIFSCARRKGRKVARRRATRDDCGPLSFPRTHKPASEEVEVLTGPTEWLGLSLSMASVFKRGHETPPRSSANS